MPNRTSETAKVEAAVRLMLRECRERGGFPQLRPKHWVKAARLLGLHAGSGVWTLNRSTETYLEANGFSPTGYIIDYEKFYRAIEARGWKKQKAAEPARSLTIKRNTT